MASISQEFFREMGLTPFGRKPDWIGPKPPPSKEIAKLAAEWDQLENLVRLAHHADTGRYAFSVDSMPFEKWTALLHRWHVVKLEYHDANTAHEESARWKAQTSTRPIKSSDKQPLDIARYHAAAHCEQIEMLYDLGVATERERADARSAQVIADDLYEIAELKFKLQERQARITGKHPRSRARRLVSDGYVKTGKFKMISGARVPVLEKVK